MDHGHADIRERHPGQHRPEGHSFARLQVGAVLHRPPQVLTDQSDRLFRKQVAHRMTALIDRALAGRQREVGVIHGCVRLDGVGQSVDAAVRGHLRRTGDGQQRIDDGDMGPQVIAQHADLQVVLAVGEDRGSRYLRARARSCRDADQGKDRAGDAVIADVVARRAAVGQDHGGDLGQVHVAAAAQAQKRIGLHPAGRDDARLGGSERRFRLAPVEQVHGYPRGSQRFADALDQPSLDQKRVGDDENTAGLEAAGDVAELSDRVATEDSRAGRVERPGFAHRGPPAEGDGGNQHGG